MRLKVIQLLIRIFGWFGVFLLLVSLLFEALPLLPNNALNSFHLAARQRGLEEHIVKDTLMLAYRSSSDDHAEAISELQTALPLWEKVQNGLQDGDTSLGISSHLPNDVRVLLLQAQPDFIYLDAAAHHILAHPSPVDATEIDIILQHDQNYFLTMGQAVIAYQDDINNAARTFFVIELVLGILLMILWIAFLILVNRVSKKNGGNDKDVGT
jgi:hypothetical protein